MVGIFGSGNRISEVIDRNLAISKITPEIWLRSLKFQQTSSSDSVVINSERVFERSFFLLDFGFLSIFHSQLSVSEKYVCEDWR